MKYLVDSDYVADFLKGRPTATDLLNTLFQDGMAMSIITFAEVYEGIYYGHNRAHYTHIFQQFLQGVSVLGITRSIAKQYALMRGELGRKQETSLVNRFLYESGGNFGLSMFVRQAARARDFRGYLSRWHGHPWWKSVLAPVVRRVWKHQGRCMHKPGEHWCRSRDTEMKVPPLGPVS